MLQKNVYRCVFFYCDTKLYKYKTDYYDLYLLKVRCCFTYSLKSEYNNLFDSDKSINKSNV